MLYSDATSTSPKLTSKDSQHLLQIRGSKQTFQLGGESLGLPQGPELTPSEDRPYESFRVLTLSPQPSDPLINFNIFFFLRKGSICPGPEDLD